MKQESVSNVMCKACRENVCRHARYNNKKIKIRRMLEYINTINNNVDKLNKLVVDLLMEEV
tara:strand:+ start:207 stop:389 length:183 start_codon:yes stop_codon:yes gene_type:complete